MVDLAPRIEIDTVFEVVRAADGRWALCFTNDGPSLQQWFRSRQGKHYHVIFEPTELKLKPCPFCGGEPELVNDGACYVRCNRCGIETFLAPNEKAVADFWNSRSGEAE